MTDKDWRKIRELRLQFMGTSKGIALGNLIAEKQRLDQVKKIVADYDGSIPSMVKQFSEIQRILEQDNVDNACDNCKYHTDAEEIHGKTPCGTCGQELINFCRKE